MLEVRIAISPRPAWINRVKLIAASIREWYPDAIITVACYPPPYEWNTEFNLLIPTAEKFEAWAGTRAEYLATMMIRYEPPFFGSHILMLDADVIPVRPFNEWFSEKGFCGVQAHVPPFSIADWRKLFSNFGLPLPEMTHKYSGHGVMTNIKFGPAYVNSGVVFGPRKMFELLADPYAAAVAYYKRVVQDVYWIDQAAWALGVGAALTPVRTFPIRYNFPNRPAFDAAFPDDLADIKFLHAMQTDIVDRDKDFESSEALDALCARMDLTGSNEVLRRRVAEIRGVAGV